MWVCGTPDLESDVVCQDVANIDSVHANVQTFNIVLKQARTQIHLGNEWMGGNADLDNYSVANTCRTPTIHTPMR